MQYWLIQFSPDTFKTVVERNVIGVRPQMRSAIEAPSVGDPFVAYVSREMVLTGKGAISGPVFDADDTLFGEKGTYPHRRAISIEHLDWRIPVKPNIWGLEPFQETANPGNLIMCKGGLIEVPKKDFDWLLSKLRT